MIESATVTLSLKDFDRLRNDEAMHKRAHRCIASQLAGCFDFSCKENPLPKECENCPTAEENYSLPKLSAGVIHEVCSMCETWHNYKELDEHLTVDVEKLINVAKSYSLWGKDVETDLDEITVTPKSV